MAIMTDFILDFDWCNPKAANVPSTVASSVTRIPIKKLLAVAPSHRGFVKKSSYHFVDQPGSGNMRSSPAVKESGNTTTMGAIRKTNTAPVNTLTK
jgi:hypothetical protein